MKPLHRSLASRLAAVFFLLAAGPHLAAQQVVQEVRHGRVSVDRIWVVDAAGGGDFTDIQPAVDAAASGDLVLVRAGDYTGFEICGKGLTIVGEGEATDIYGASVVCDLQVEQFVVLRSLFLHHHFASPKPGAPPILLLEDNAGTAWIEDCTITAFSPWEDVVRVINGSSTVLVRSELTANSTIASSPHVQRHALRATDSSVYAFETDFVAQGYSGCFGCPNTHEGDIGALVEEAYLYAAGCTFQGGQGTARVCLGSLCISSPGDGGPGLRVIGMEADSLSSSFAGGSAGDNSPCPLGSPCSNDGDPGVGVEGPIEVIPLPTRTLALDGPVRSGGSAQLLANCQPGEAVWSVYSDIPEATYIPLYFGPQLPAPPVTLVFEGIADGTGTLDKLVPIPPLGLFSSFEVSFVQGLFFDALANAFIGSPSTLIVVD